jgi:hypothetical protein
MQDVRVDFPATGKFRPFDGVSSWLKLKALKVKGIGISRVHNLGVLSNILPILLRLFEV